MRNRRGEAYIFTCVLVIVISMVASVLLVFATSISMVRYTKDNVTLTLDSYVMQNSVEIYHSIKQGNNAVEVLDTGQYLTQLCQFASLDRQGDVLYALTRDGQVKYSMTVPEVRQVGGGLDLEVCYTLHLPIRFLGRVVMWAQVPVTVRSVLTSKF